MFTSTLCRMRNQQPQLASIQRKSRRLWMPLGRSPTSDMGAGTSLQRAAMALAICLLAPQDVHV